MLVRVRDWSPRRWGAAVFSTALMVAVAMVLVIFERQGLVDQDVDPYYFGEMGSSIAAGNGFEGFGTLIQRRAPLYPLTIGGVYTILGESTRAVFLLHALMFAITATLAYDIGRRLFNVRTGVLAGVACTFHPMLLRYIPNLHLETQLTVLFTLMVWLMVRFRERPTVLFGAALGVAAAATSLTKSVAVLLPAAFVGIFILMRWRKQKRGQEVASVPWVPFAVMFVAMGLTIVPWTIRNYQVTGHIVPISSGASDAFLRGFIFTENDFITLQRPPFTDAENASNEYFAGLAQEAGTVWELDDYETDQILNEEAKRRLFAEPGAVARKSFIGIFTFWYMLTSFKNSLLALVLAVGAWALTIVGWRRARSEDIETWVVLLPVLYLNFLLALLLALGRYSVPILPALMVMAAFGVDTLWNRWFPGRNPEVAT